MPDFSQGDGEFKNVKINQINKLNNSKLVSFMGRISLGQFIVPNEMSNILIGTALNRPLGPVQEGHSHNIVKVLFFICSYHADRISPD